MKMTTLELQRLMPAPARAALVPTDRDWQEAERALGITLPSDYRDFLCAYGSGRVDDFLEIFNPASPHEYNNLVECWKQQREVFEYMQKGGMPLSFDLFPATPGLLPIGQTDNGDTIFYVVRGEPAAWAIAVLESRGRDVKVFEMSLTSFLVAGLKHQVDALPDGLAAVFVPRVG
jgi:hypothetical protein